MIGLPRSNTAGDGRSLSMGVARTCNKATCTSPLCCIVFLMMDLMSHMSFNKSIAFWVVR